MAVSKITKAEKNIKASVTQSKTKPMVKVTTEQSEQPQESKLSSFLSRLPFGRGSIRKVPVSKKQWALILTVIGFGILVYIVSKYLIVAWVDNQPITRIEYYNQLDKRYGKDLKEQMIVQTLLTNEARKKGINVTDQDLNNEIKKVEKDQGGAEKLNQVLQLQGISQSEFSNLIKLQIIRQKLFSENINISDDEVNKYIEQNKTQFAEDQINDKLKAQIKDELKQQKISQNFNTWVQSNLQGPRVKRV